MSSFIWPSLSAFFLCAVILGHQEHFTKRFCTDSQKFNWLLAISRYAGSITGFIYIGYYGWLVSWWVAVLLVPALLVAGVVVLFSDKLTPQFTFAGFWGWPLCAFYMFKSLPNSA